jgi:enoyl-CoA hydratase/carnithine racemase
MAVNTRREGGTVTLELARPERGNALGEALVEALIEQLRTALADDAVHTIVLRGQGRHFCTGLDLSDLEHAGDAQWLRRLVRIETLLATVWSAPKRTVAVAQGRTWGAGADLFAACEVRVALPGTTLRFPGARFGVVLGTRRLAARVGEVRARRLVTEGGELDAQQALQCGLADANEEPVLPEPVVHPHTAAAIRAATRPGEEAALAADLAALVRSAAEPGLAARLAAYVAALRPGSR